ncbi:hypothetical protein V5799_019370 [Amblyomma americanum]|uniref:Secreted protein n=1 Tax=Amblyomma americanum TaxID=6943 RepID=A0AAQ4EWZ3_AMBAM
MGSRSMICTPVWRVLAILCLVIFFVFPVEGRESISCVAFSIALYMHRAIFTGTVEDNSTEMGSKRLIG